MPPMKANRLLPTADGGEPAYIVRTTPALLLLTAP